MTKSEAETRSILIDQQLAKSGWDVEDPIQLIDAPPAFRNKAGVRVRGTREMGHLLWRLRNNRIESTA